MDVCYNEFVNIDYKLIKNNGQCLVVYRRLKNCGTNILATSILTHHVYDIFTENPLSEEIRDKYSANIRFDPESNSISLLWDTYPVDHFLCVSYVFIEKNAPSDFSWLKDGF
jgi:hypothetical protein